MTGRPFREILPRLVRGDLAAAREGFEALLAGELTPVQVGGFAVALLGHGESSEVLVEGARALSAAMIPVEHGLPLVVDTCGTGGDGAGTFNVSTAAALVVAAAGLPVAKHGNRAVSSRSGSADVVEALGIPLDLDATKQGRLLREQHIAFLMAPAHHPALRHAAEARRQLGVRTVFNALGPLVNPARATHQVVGVYDDALRRPMAEALLRLGIERAWVVRSEDGLDEISGEGITRVSEIHRGSVVERTVRPEDFGLSKVPRAALAGGDAEANARAIEEMAKGAPHAASEVVVLNAAAALHVARGTPLREAAEEAKQLLRDGAVAKLLLSWRGAARAT